MRKNRVPISVSDVEMQARVGRKRCPISRDVLISGVYILIEGLQCNIKHLSFCDP